MKTALLFFLVLIFLNGTAQKIFVEKIHKGAESRFAIVIESPRDIKKYTSICSFKPITLLPDTTKIRLIGELLSLTNDTSMSSEVVLSLSGHYVGNKIPVSKRYNLQIEALVFVNYIAFSSRSFSYSPFPLLYNRDKKTEIYSSGKDLNFIIDRYNKWYNELLKKGFHDYRFPDLGQQYEWYFYHANQKKFAHYPDWDDYYNCKEIE